MKQRSAARLAWGLWVLFVLLAGGAVVLSILVSGRSAISAGVAATVAFMVAMLAMADRLEALGGTFQIDSSPGSGTKVTGRIPVVRR